MTSRHDVSHLTVGALNAQIAGVLRANFAQEMWVVGELQGFDRAHGKHRYFELVERRNEQILSRIDAVVFQDSHADVLGKFRAAAPDVELRDGLEVRVRARVDFFAARGRVQVQITDIDPLHTTGALNAQRDQVLRRLRAEGLHDQNLARPMPACPLRVAMITSLHSDAYNDVVSELQASGYAFDVTVFGAVMQGVNTENSVLSALRQVYKSAAELDVALIVRGGGSRSDLAWFDSYKIGRAVCLTPVKFVAGVGHHRDQSVLDFVAHSVKTPTAAAQYLVQHVAEFELRLSRVAQRVAAVVDHKVLRQARALDAMAHRLTTACGTRLHVASNTLEAHGVALDVLARAELARARVGLESHRASLRAMTQRALDREAARLELAQARCELMNPRRLLDRGFAMVTIEGKLVTELQRIGPGAQIEIQMKGGRLTATVERVTHD